jgi:hypothetical protein
MGFSDWQAVVVVAQVNAPNRLEISWQLAPSRP